MKTLKAVGAVLSAAIISGCVSGEISRSSRVDLDDDTIDGAISSADIRTVASRMAPQILSVNEVANVVQPVRIKIADFKNTSRFFIDRDIFAKRLRLELNRYATGRVKFIDKNEKTQSARVRVLKDRQGEDLRREMKALGCEIAASPVIANAERPVKIAVIPVLNTDIVNMNADACAAMLRSEIINASGGRVQFLMPGHTDGAEQIFTRLAAEPTVSKPLYDLERASVMLVSGRHEEAHELMMKTRGDIETLFDKTSEERAMSLWHGENNKVFKGDNHERSVMYALLAMSFLERGEWEDAERCVKNGLLADSMNTKEVRYNSDFALLQYLGYVACKRGGRESDAAEYQREMQQSLGSRRIPTGLGTSVGPLMGEAELPDAFLVVWCGEGPSYVRGGEYEEIRYVVAGHNPYNFFSVDFGGGAEYVLPSALADINFQATTRGGRKMDTVLADKATVKKGMAASGNLLLIAGYACISCMGSDAKQQLVMGSIGGGLLLLGCTFHIVGSCINAKADIRSWKTLPAEMLVMPVKLNGAAADCRVRSYYEWDNVQCKKARLEASANGIGVKHVVISAPACGFTPYDFEAELKAIQNYGNYPSKNLKAEIEL